jgi:hypothetical protein
MRVLSLSLPILAASLVLVACTSSESKNTTGTAGTGGGAAGAGGAGQSGGGSAGSNVGAAGAGSAGTNGSAGGAAGTSGGAGAGAAGASGTAGAGTDGGAGSSSNTDGAAQIVDGAPVTSAGCANHDYPLCIDFESGLDTTVWGTHANAGAIETTEVAHGTHAYHLYSSDKAAPQGGIMVATNLGAITSQIWGRFYIHFSPGPPGNHGNLIGASDGVWCQGCTGSNYNGNWYEIGWQFDGILGDFHLENGMERPLRSLPYLVDRWYCIELFIDGTVKGNERWWIDGAEAQYYTPQAGVCCAATNPTTPESVLIPQFKSITVGWTPYQGLGLMLPDQNKIVDNRVLNDAWIDDVAFDTKRVGCIQ